MVIKAHAMHGILETVLPSLMYVCTHNAIVSVCMVTVTVTLSAE